VITWNVIRAAGIGAYLMLWASVTWGLVATTSLFGKKVPKATSVALHQAFSTLGVVLLAVHLGFLVADRFMPFSPLDLVIPLRATYRPWGVAFGIVAMGSMVVVLVSSWGRKLLGTSWWRRLHTLSVPAFSLALVHGLMTGTDTPRPATYWFYLATTGILLFLVLGRAFTVGLRARRAPAAEGAAARGRQVVPAGSPERVHAMAEPEPDHPHRPRHAPTGHAHPSPAISASDRGTSMSGRD
jgi:sulfoxide reductase heme-binding subunit YedZ